MLEVSINVSHPKVLIRAKRPNILNGNEKIRILYIYIYIYIYNYFVYFIIHLHLEYRFCYLTISDVEQMTVSPNINKYSCEVNLVVTS